MSGRAAFGSSSTSSKPTVSSLFSPKSFFQIFILLSLTFSTLTSKILAKSSSKSKSSGTVFLQMLAPKTENNNFSIGSVTFEPNARSNWHTHPAGQTLIVINGTGLYQEKGKPIRRINKGETILCDPDIEHWHGASPTSQMTHIAINNFKGDSNVNWLKPVTDEEYKTEVK